MLESISKLAYLAGAKATSADQLDSRGRTIVDVLVAVYSKTAEQYSEQYQVIDGTEKSLADELFKGLFEDGED